MQRERVSVSDSIFYSKMCVFDEAWNASESQPPVLLSQLNTHLSASPYPSLNSVSTEWLTYCPAPVPCMSAPLIIPFLSFPLSHAFLLLTLSGDRCLPLQLPLWTFPALQTERGNTSQREPRGSRAMALKISAAVQSGSHSLSRESLERVAELCTPAESTEKLCEVETLNNGHQVCVTDRLA